MKRLALIGDSCVGKTTIVNLLQGRNCPSICTAGINYTIVESDNKKYEIIDTSGMSRLKAIIPMILPVSDNIVIVSKNKTQTDEWNKFLDSCSYEGSRYIFTVKDKITSDTIDRFKKILSTL